MRPGELRAVVDEECRYARIDRTDEVEESGGVFPTGERDRCWTALQGRTHDVPGLDSTYEGLKLFAVSSSVVSLSVFGQYL